MRAFAIAVFALAAAPALAADKAQGEWLTPGGESKVQIAPCAGKADQLCGKIVWLKTPAGPNGEPLRDANNSDASLRQRPILGLPLMNGFKSAGPGRWTGGRIYDPRSGRSYASKLSLNADGSLKVEGCMVGICQAQTWRRAS